jgi:hypothetical protein
MIVSSILYREQLKITDKIKVLWTPINTEFEDFIKSAGCELVNFSQLYYGDNIPNLIICNNKIEFHNDCASLSRKLHLPVLLIDHTIKNPLYDNEKIKQMNHFPCMHHICISKKVSDSWDLKDVQILSYNSKDEDNIKIWQNLLFQITKKMFKI